MSPPKDKEIEPINDTFDNVVNAIIEKPSSSVSRIPQAIATGSLRIGDVEIPCAVLDDEKNTRVLTQEGFLVAIGRSKRPNASSPKALDDLPAFLRANNLNQFIDKNIKCSTTPIPFRPLKGGGTDGLALGFEADLLPEVCWVYHDAKNALALKPNQEHIAEKCDQLLRGLTNVAIIALVDEVTGFQDIRSRNALQKILDKYVSPEVRPWSIMFDNEFYKLVFKLNGWAYDPTTVRRPSVIGHWTNDIYDRLAPGVREELHRIAKRKEDGSLVELLHPHLTEEGAGLMNHHLAGIKALMRASSTWAGFKRMLDKSYPKMGNTLEMDLEEQ